MIKRFILLALTLTVFGFTFDHGPINYVQEQKMGRPHVEARLLKYFNELDSIYVSKGIVIDYSKVSSIQSMDSLPYDPVLQGKSLEGLYNKHTNQVYINTYQLDAFFKGKYKEKILLIMAHEIGHSQGMGHSNDTTSIMYYSSKYVSALLDNNKIEDLVSEMYLN
jgi:hypothetical protein